MHDTSLLAEELQSAASADFADLLEYLAEIVGVGDAAEAAYIVDDWDEPTVNVFCPTGPGGGIDPTCKADGHHFSPRVEQNRAAGEAWVKGLNHSERSQIEMWTGDGFAEYRADYKAGRSGADDRFLKAFETALEKAPKHEGYIYRGLTKDYGDVEAAIASFKKAGVGGTWHDPAPMSTTVDPFHAHNFARGDVMMRIASKTGREIQAGAQDYEKEEEREVVVLPGTKLRIKNIYENHTYHIEGKAHKVRYFVDLEEITGNENPYHAADGKFTSKSGVGKAIDAVSSLEHKAKELAKGFADKMVSKLPEGGQKAAYKAGEVGAAVGSPALKVIFAGYTAAQAFADRVAKERGYTDEQRESLSKVLKFVDLGTFEALKVGSFFAHGLAPAAGATGLVPVASASYIAYSAAADFPATFRAAQGVVRDTINTLKAKFGPSILHSKKRLLEEASKRGLTANEANGAAIADALEAHNFDEWYSALFVAALDELDDAESAITLADALYEPTSNTKWAFTSNSVKLAEFNTWLRSKFKAHLLTDDQYWKAYIAEGFAKGAGRAFDDTKKKQKLIDEAQGKLSYYEGTKDQFLKSTFGNSVSKETLEILVSRVYTDLEGVTEAMAAAMTRTLADGLVAGSNPNDIAQNLVKNVDGIGINRATTLARTEIIRAHAEGQLAALEAMGVEDVGVMVEWSVSGLGTTKKGNPSPCPKCAPMKGTVLKVSEAKGMIPRHPNCMCAWLPAGVGEDTAGQKLTKKEIVGAIRESKGSDAWGPADSISSDRMVTNSLLAFSDIISRYNVTANESNCGAGTDGRPGFQPGNTCAGDAGGPSGGSNVPVAPKGTAVSPQVAKAVSEVRESSKKHAEEQLKQVADHYKTDAGTVRQKLQAAFDKAEITINFKPQNQGADGGFLGDLLAKEGKLKSVFETGKSGVSDKLNIDKYKADRDGWEKERISPHAADVPANERPKYAAVNWGGGSEGAAPVYGGGVFVLNKEHFKGKLTLTPDNTSRTGKHEAASGDDPINALARSGKALRAAGISAPEDRVKGTRPNSYTEVHVWGEMPLNKDTIKEIRLKQPKFYQLEAKRAQAGMVKWAEAQGIPVRFY